MDVCRIKYRPAERNFRRMKTEIIIALWLAVASLIGCGFVIYTGIKEAKRNKKNGPFKDRK